jgi:hypothetical protein
MAFLILRGRWIIATACITASTFVPVLGGRRLASPQSLFNLELTYEFSPVPVPWSR